MLASLISGSVYGACSATDTVCLEVSGTNNPGVDWAPELTDNAGEPDVTDVGQNSISDSVRELVDGITADLKKRRLRLPEGDNALEKVRRLQQLDSSHDYAINGHRYVARIYLTLARWQLRNGNREKSLEHVQSALKVDGTVAGIAELARLLDSTAVASVEMLEPALQLEPAAVDDSETTDSTASVPILQTDESGFKPAEEWTLHRASRYPVMVAVPAGSFIMGSESLGLQSKPLRRVALQAFSMSRFEVTIAQYRRFAIDRGAPIPPTRGVDDSLPITGVNWLDAHEYVQWLSAETGREYRLPTESEWEYAARAGTITAYFWGDQLQQANCVGCDSREQVSPLPVGSYPANDFGLFDMHGNVWEWVEDCWQDSYVNAPADGSAQPGGENCTQRVLRGGSWYNLAAMAQSAYRGHEAASFKDGGVGFRVVHEGL